MALPILKERPITFRDAFVPYTMAGLNMLAPTLATRDIVLPQIILVAVLLILVGLPCSILFRQRQYNRILLNLLVTVPLLVLTWSLVHTHPGLQINWSDPLGSLFFRDIADQLEGLLYLFVLLAAGRAFLLVTPREVMQTPIPGFTILLLVVVSGTRSGQVQANDPLLLLCLLVLLTTSLYLLGYDQGSRWFAQDVPLRFQRQLLAITLWVVLLLFPVVLFLGWAMEPYNMYSLAQMRHGPRSMTPWNLPSLGRKIGLSFAPYIEMGGTNWPNGNVQVMTVRVESGPRQDLLWRAGTYDTYVFNGGWKWLADDRSPVAGPLPRPFGDEASIWRKTDTGAAIDIQLTPDGPEIDPGIRGAIADGALRPDFMRSPWAISQRFTVEPQVQGDRLPVFGAQQIMRVRSQDQGFARTVLARDGSLRVPVGLRDQRMEYTVVSLVKPLPGGLSLHPGTMPPLREREEAMYLQMPDGTFTVDGQPLTYWAAVRRKAEEILQQRDLTPSSPPIDIVHQFEFYLGRNYRYTLRPTPPRPGQDPILDFLYTQKRGYCNYFSGALVMLCRSVGIPARFVVGFATGDPVEGEREPGYITYRVLAKHAHSWVEVFLPNYGWYTSDPTAGSTEVPTVWGRTWDFFSHGLSRLRDSINAWLTLVRQDPEVRIYTYLVGTGLLLIAGGVLYLRRERPPSLPRHALSEAEARKTVLSAYRKMHRWLTMWGVIKPHGLTATEFDRLFRTLHSPMEMPVSELSGLYLRAQYGDEPMGDPEARRAIELLTELWRVGRDGRKQLHATPAE